MYYLYRQDKNSGQVVRSHKPWPKAAAKNMIETFKSILG